MTMHHRFAPLDTGLGAATSFIRWPQARLGIAAPTNAQLRGLPEAIALAFMQRKLHDLYLPADRFAGRPPPAAPKPAQSLASHEGRYANAYFGDAQITPNATGDAPELSIGPAAVRHRLRHWDGDVFVFTPRGESTAPGSLSAIGFAPGQMQIELYSEDLAHGLFERVAAQP